MIDIPFGRLHTRADIEAYRAGLLSSLDAGTPPDTEAEVRRALATLDALLATLDALSDAPPQEGGV